MMRVPALLMIGLASLLALASIPAGAVTAVPPGNAGMEQPAVPGASARRTKALKTTYEAKYQKVFNLLKRDRKLRGKIVKEAGRFGIDPLHIAGAIVGEHTYNVDAYDHLQTYYMKAVAYMKNDIVFQYDGETVGEFVARPQFERCNGMAGSLAVWTCREQVWNSAFRGKTVDGKAFPNDRLSATFFQPFYSGQTFGIGQMNPLTALMMSDYVHEVTGLPRLDHRKGKQVYETIMNPDYTLAYVAATLRHSIDAYRKIAGFDISTNPGITATLYNTGGADGRARALARKNKDRAAAGEAPLLPEVNYYGWWVNEKLPDLQGLF